MNIRLRSAVVVVSAVALLGLVGCSGSETESTATTTESVVTTIGAGELAQVVADPEIVVLDVRTPVEYADGHVEGAVNVDVSSPTFTDEIASLDKYATYVVYCRSGNRSADAAGQMAEAGFTAVYDVDAGLATLSSAGVPLTQ